VTTDYDIIIIGTGAGGGTLAYRLAPSGKRILLLERGDYLPREPENWSSREAFVTGRYATKEHWYDKDGHVFHPHAHYWVGGNTKVYGAVLFRLRERDFGEVKHHDGISPAWPLSYNDFEPYYTEAERLYLVHGERGEDPTEPPASGAFPYPAVSHEPRIQKLSDDLERTGHRPFHLPLGINLDEKNKEASRCVRCEFFDGFPCLVDGKADAHVCAVRPALTHDNVTLLTGEGRASRDRRCGADDHRRGCRPQRRTGDLQGRRRRCLLWRDQFGGAATAVCGRPSSQRTRKLLRSRGAALHVSP
jgi:choline dehydrogenase-like flavoprotein